MSAPRGPNLRRSCTAAWKKVRAKRSLHHSCGLAHPSNTSAVIVAHVPFRLARMPTGGSKVIFTDACKTGTGKYGTGIEVNQSRNSSCVVALPELAISSTIFCSFGIHDLARWQFCSTTHPPFTCASWISASAIGPCPWPSEIGRI